MYTLYMNFQHLMLTAFGWVRYARKDQSQFVILKSVQIHICESQGQSSLGPCVTSTPMMDFLWWLKFLKVSGYLIVYSIHMYTPYLKSKSALACR